MLVLSRRVGEKIVVDDRVVVTMVRVQGDRVRVGIEAPPDVVVHREEIHRRASSDGTPASSPVPALT